jgi:predicted transcriptional regulator of viral defense system
MGLTLTQQILDMASTRGAICGSDLKALRASSDLLRSMTGQGLLIRSARGIYTLPDFSITEHHTLVEVAVRHSRATICVLSALRFHELGTQLPWQVWIAIPKQDREPISDLPIRVHRFSGDALVFGVETHTLEGVSVRVTSKAKTVADCFKYRNKLGLDVAIEALRDFLHERVPGAITDLHVAAGICRVERIMKPYIEALL